MSSQDLHIEKAYEFYRQSILDVEKQRLRQEYNFPVVGSVPSTDWELFGAILVGDKKKSGYGSDLSNSEVKSAVEGNSFEYQYHRNHGEEKLKEDIDLDYHIFISYSPDYQNVVVRRVPGSALSSIFEGWLPDLQSNYARNDKQRYRKSISYGTVVSKGEIIMEIRGGELV